MQTLAAATPAFPSPEWARRGCQFSDSALAGFQVVGSSGSFWGHSTYQDSEATVTFLSGKQARQGGVDGGNAPLWAGEHGNHTGGRALLGPGDEVFTGRGQEEWSSTVFIGCNMWLQDCIGLPVTASRPGNAIPQSRKSDSPASALGVWCSHLQRCREVGSSRFTEPIHDVRCSVNHSARFTYLLNCL